MTPFWSDSIASIYHGRAEEVLPSLPDASVSLIATDPPYYRVKTDLEWDCQWDTPEEFLAWLGGLCIEWRRVLKPNGSIYVFASAEMAWSVEGEVRRHFDALNQITWTKPNDPGFDGWKQKCSKESLRRFYPQSERIIFAAQPGDSDEAERATGYQRSVGEATREVRRNAFGDHLKAELDRAGVTCKDAAAAIGAHGAVNHGGSVSNWVLGYGLPSEDQYVRLMEWVGSKPTCGPRTIDAGDALGEARQQFNGLRELYRSLRRPFQASADVAFTDVWDFPSVRPYPGKHPCEKSVSMMSHIVEVSSRPGDVVLDSFMGYGATLRAAKNLGRRAIGIDADERCCRVTVERLRQELLFAPEARPA